jgi:hypothetical protein
METWMTPEDVMARRPKEVHVPGELTEWERRLADLKPLRVDLPIEGDGTTYRAVADALRVMAAAYERAALAVATPPVTRFRQLKWELKEPRARIREQLLPRQRPEVYNSKRNGVAR